MNQDPDREKQAGPVSPPPAGGRRPRTRQARWIMAGVLAVAVVSLGATWWLSRTEPVRQSLVPGALRHSLLAGSIGGAGDERSFSWGFQVDGRPGGIRWDFEADSVILGIEIEPASDLQIDLEYDGRILECAGVTPNFWRNKSWVDIAPGSVRMNLPGIGKRVVAVQLRAVQPATCLVRVTIHRGAQVLFRKEARCTFS